MSIAAATWRVALGVYLWPQPARAMLDFATSVAP